MIFIYCNFYEKIDFLLAAPLLLVHGQNNTDKITPEKIPPTIVDKLKKKIWNMCNSVSLSSISSQVYSSISQYIRIFEYIPVYSHIFSTSTTSEYIRVYRHRLYLSISEYISNIEYIRLFEYILVYLTIQVYSTISEYVRLYPKYIRLFDYTRSIFNYTQLYD